MRYIMRTNSRQKHWGYTMLFKQHLLERYGALLCALAISASTSVIAAASTPTQDFIVGIGTHLGFNRGDPKQIVNLLRGANITSFRDDVPWEQVEQTKGKLIFPESLKRLDTAVNLAISEGIQPLLILDY